MKKELTIEYLRNLTYENKAVFKENDGSIEPSWRKDVQPHRTIIHSFISKNICVDIDNTHMWLIGICYPKANKDILLYNQSPPPKLDRFLSLIYAIEYNEFPDMADIKLLMTLNGVNVPVILNVLQKYLNEQYNKNNGKKSHEIDASEMTIVEHVKKFKNLIENQ